MFDDHPALPTQGSAPTNLPIGEPLDIFEGTEAAEPVAPAAPMAAAPASMGAPASPPVAASALNAGILTPKVTVPPPPSVMGTENAIKEPKLSRGIMVTIMALVIGFVLLGSGWFVYHIFTKKPADVAVVPVETLPSPTNTTTDAVLPTVPTTPSIDVTPATSSDAVDHEIIAGESPDSDGDGLKDDREKELGTDPSNWDTDSDDLSDGEEVLIWHTNPKNADTDGDTYKDGAEVKAGYNPSGPGRLAEISTSTSTPVATNSTASSTVSTSSTPVTTSSTSSANMTSSSSVHSPGDIEL